MTATIALNTNIATLTGIGPRKAAALRAMGIRSVADLVRHLPLRYEHELGEHTIAQAGRVVGPEHKATANVTVRGEIATVRPARGRKPRIEATLQDDTGTIMLTWFNARWMLGKLHPGMNIIATGKANRFGDYLQMVNPQWREAKFDDEPEEDDSSASGEEARLRPVYSTTEDIRSSDIHRAVEQVLDDVLPLLKDHLHDQYRQERSLPGLSDAYRMMHRPADFDEVKSARRRLALDELLLLQLGVFLKRKHRRVALQAIELKYSHTIDEHIRARLPFELTDAQNEVVYEIATDLQTSAPMNRLLQGDVGSGKTAVALYAMLMAVASNQQAALMAPTEILAEQHYTTITNMLHDSSVTIALLTGTVKPAERQTIEQQLATGKIDLVIGTHALLTESTQFHGLALAVIDEQHRFGVHQRAALRAKAGEESTIPHTLVMTATPIPRTLSMTVFGDLDISTIRALPPGRQPIVTRVVTPHKRNDVYEYIAGRIADGEQAYIVVPVIDESESGLKSITAHHDWLQKGPLRDLRIAAVHGRLKRDERETIMTSFRAGDIDILLATTVIEVGIDVPNASIMVIENADRFGLAQLHQLRGRVGRGERKSLCVLIGDPVTEDGRLRLEAMAATNDGFDIAERDLLIRGPGEVFGSRQAGAAPFRVARLPDDLDLLRLARRDAEQWIDDNPTLEGERDALLRRRLLKAHGESLGIGDVA